MMTTDVVDTTRRQTPDNRSQDMPEKKPMGKPTPKSPQTAKPADKGKPSGQQTPKR